MTKRIIKRGEIYIADLEPAKGSEQGKERRVLIVSNDIGNKVSPIVIAVPITSDIDERSIKFPQNVLIHPSKKNGLVKKSIILCGQIRVLSVKQRIGEFKGTVEKETLDSVDEALNTTLALKRCPECDYVLMPNAKRCVNRECKKILVHICLGCNEVINYRYKFCPHCGKKVGGGE